MKIIKTSSNKKTVRISQQDWTNIGKKAGWLKVSIGSIPTVMINIKKLEIFIDELAKANSIFNPPITGDELLHPNDYYGIGSFKNFSESKKIQVREKIEELKNEWDFKYKSTHIELLIQFKNLEFIPKNISKSMNRLVQKFNSANNGLYWCPPEYARFIDQLDRAAIAMQKTIARTVSDWSFADFYGNNQNPEETKRILKELGMSEEEMQKLRESFVDWKDEKDDPQNWWK